MTVLKSVRSRKFLAALSALAAVAATLLGANVASGDEVWYQSYQRGSASEACVAQAGETPWQDSWGTNPGWSPSWEQWANNGQGGWVCSRSITWAQTPVPASSSSGGSSSVTYAVGDTGPGEGLVFLISGGLTYEMAKKTWSGGIQDPSAAWCSDTTTTLSGTFSTAVGTGSANTTAMQSPACSSGAGVSARAYAGGGFTDWFLPSKDELNAMCYYSRNLSATPDPTVSCYGSGGTTQDGTFAAGNFGFASDYYLSSSQNNATQAWYQLFGGGMGGGSGDQLSNLKYDPRRVRPVRAF